MSHHISKTAPSQHTLYMNYSYLTHVDFRREFPGRGSILGEYGCAIPIGIPSNKPIKFRKLLRFSNSSVMQPEPPFFGRSRKNRRLQLRRSNHLRCKLNVKLKCLKSIYLATYLAKVNLRELNMSGTVL